MTTETSTRHLGLDVMRGLAIYGIGIVNATYFFMPWGIASDWTNMSSSDVIAWWIVRLGFEDKFVGVFSLLFGIGMALQHRRAASNERPYAPIGLRRMITLFALGVLHGALLWYGDILTAYAVGGVLLLSVVRCRARTLAILGATLLVAAWTQYGINWIRTFDAASAPVVDVGWPGPAPTFPEAGLDRYEALVDASGGDVYHWTWDEAETMANREGPLAATLDMRWRQYRGWLMTIVTSGFGLRILGMFCLGAAILKAGWLDGHGRRVRRLLVRVALPVGLLLEVISAATWTNASFTVTRGMVLADMLHVIAAPVLAVAFVAMFLELARAQPTAWHVRLPCDVGRMSLTSYIATTLLATTAAGWWGLGLFAELTRMQSLGVMVVIMAVITAGAVAWRSRIEQGPIEWVWRRLTYWRA